MKSKIAEKPLLSAIIPITKMHKKLKRFEEWFYMARDLPIEIIIVHDVQDKQTKSDLDLILENAKRLKIKYKFIEGTYGAPGLARNAGMPYVNGEWIVFWDSDDFPYVESVLNLIETYRHSNIDCIIPNYEIVNEKNNEKTIHRMYRDEIVDIAITVGLWRFIFRSSSLDSIEFSDLKLGEDQLFIAEYSLSKHSYTLSNVIVYKYYFGTKSHLVNQREYYSDLVTLHSRTAKILKNIQSSSKDEKRFIIIQYVRQFFTGLKKCNCHDKHRLLQNFFKILIKKPKLMFELFYSTILILFYKREIS